MALERAASLRREVSTSTNRQDQLQLSLSEELSGLAIDRPEDKTFFCNRSICLEQMLRDEGWTQVKGPVKNGALTKDPATGKPVSAVFAYWDVFGGVPPVPSPVDNWPRACTNCLDNLYTMFVRLDATCKARDVVPDTVIGPAWRALTREKFETCPVWFIKDVFGVRGKGITCVNTFEDYQHFASTMSKEGYLIQRSIHNMLTVARGQDGSGAEWQCVPYTEGGYKTGLRAYFISRGDGAFFMCSEMLCYVHGVPYDPNSADIKSQSVHGTQADTGRNVFLWSEFDSNPEVKNSVTHACLAAAQKLVPMIHDVMSKYTGELCRGQGALQYQFWGVDFLPTTDNKAYFVEMNGWPNLWHRQPAEVAWHKKADSAMMALLGYAGFDNPQMPEIAGQPRVWTQLCEPLPTFKGIAPAYEVYEAAA